MKDEELRGLYRSHLTKGDAGNRTACPPPERLREVLDREGSEEARLATMNHVMACRHCLPEFEMLRSVNEALPGQKPAFRWMAIAAAAVLVIGAALIGRQVIRPGEDVLRDGPTLRLLSPRSGEQLAQPVRLVWNRVPEAVEYQVEVLTTDGAPATTFKTADTTAVLDSLPAGEFIWQVSAAYTIGEPLRARPSRFSVTKP
jgi:hypothetical protein